MKREELIIVDGHNYLYRAYFGIPQTATLPNGIKVNAYYGFMAFLRKLIEIYLPEKLLVIFDSERGTVKKQLERPEYKSNRNYEDTGIFEQLKIIKRALDFVNVQYLEDERYEADDIIATLAKRYKTSFISSNDNDFIQCVDDKVILLKSIKGKYVEYTKNYVLNKFGFLPVFYLDYISLKGDLSDNIKGVPGIGKKTANKLIKEYGEVEKIFNADLPLSSLAKEVAKARDSKEVVLSNKRFLKISNDIDINVDIKFLNSELLTNKSSNEILKELSLYK